MSDEVLEGLRERQCAMPECEEGDQPGLFCGYHHSTAVGEAGSKELRMLTREMERMGRITDKQKKKAAVGRFPAENVWRAGISRFYSQERYSRRSNGRPADAELGMELGRCGWRWRWRFRKSTIRSG
ncbi:MAG: hypothetical protein R2848_15360 [Thermomicrobiales bacterium]